MTCERSVQLLPWYVNESLDPGEREEVEEHLATCEACRAELAATRRAFGVYATHPGVEELVDHVLGRGDQATRERVSRHAAHCAACREELELVEESRSELASEESAPAPAEEPAGGRVVPFRERREPDRPAARRAWRWLSVAASLLALVGLTGWFFAASQAGLEVRERQAELERLSEELAALEAELGRTAEASGEGGLSDDEVLELRLTIRDLEQQADALEARSQAQESEIARLRSELGAGESIRLLDPVALEPRPVLRSGAGEEEVVQTVSLSRAGRDVPIRLESARSRPAPPYRLEISGSAVANPLSLRVDSLDDLMEVQLAVPRALLEPGELHLELVGSDGDSETFRVEVRE